MHEKHPAAERNQGFPQLAVWQQPPNHPPALNHPATHAGRAETRGWGLTTAERVNQTPRAAVGCGLTLETGG